MTAKDGEQGLSRYYFRMRVVGHCVSLAALLLPSPCASTRAHRGGEIIVVARPWFAVCLGTCPNYDVSVRDDGRVIAVRHGFERADEVERFRVSPAEAAAFRARLDRYRPIGEAPIPAFCKHHVPSDLTPLLLRVTELEIRWSDARPSRLVACAIEENARLVEDIRRALWSAHLYLNASRRDQGD